MKRVIDGTVNGVATVAQRVGGRLRRMQSGNTRSYATWVVVGAVVRHRAVARIWDGALACSHTHLLTVLTFLPLAGRRCAASAASATIMPGFAAWRWPLPSPNLSFRCFCCPAFAWPPPRLSVRGIVHRWIPAPPILLPPGRRRHQPVPGFADHFPHAARDSCSWKASRCASRNSSSCCWCWRPA